jgi:hypothetical protein
MSRAGLGADDILAQVGTGIRRAHIVADRDVIELIDETGGILRRLPCDERVTTNLSATCKRLVAEALELGYTVFDLEFRSDPL